MTGRYFFISSPGIQNDGVVVLDGDEAHHMINVMRLEVGDEVSLIDGTGKLYLGIINGRRKSVAEVEILEVIEKPPPRIDIALGIIREPRLEWAVEKCTELGIGGFIPFVSKRSIWKGDTGRGLKKVERLRRKAIAACKQSGQVYLPEISEPIDFSRLLKIVEGYDTAVLADSGGEVLASIGLPMSDPSSGRVLGIVGPEGGFDEVEKEELKSAGVLSLSLGRSTLRAETAAFSLTFLLNYALLTKGLV